MRVLSGARLNLLELGLDFGGAESADQSVQLRVAHCHGVRVRGGGRRAASLHVIGIGIELLALDGGLGVSIEHGFGELQELLFERDLRVDVRAVIAFVRRFERRLTVLLHHHNTPHTPPDI